MKRRWKWQKTPKIWFFSHFFPKNSFTPILTAMVFLMVWEVLNMKITTKKLSKNFKGGWNDDENAPKRKKRIFSNFFLWIRFWRRRCLFMLWGMLNTKITEKKMSKNFKGWQNDDEKYIFSSKKQYFPQFLHQGLFHSNFNGESVFFMVWGLLNTKNYKKNSKRFLKWENVFFIVVLPPLKIFWHFFFSDFRVQHAPKHK